VKPYEGRLAVSKKRHERGNAVGHLEARELVGVAAADHDRQGDIPSRDVREWTRGIKAERHQQREHRLVEVGIHRGAFVRLEVGAPKKVNAGGCKRGCERGAQVCSGLGGERQHSGC
jgi:hypothetical protein